MSGAIETAVRDVIETTRVEQIVTQSTADELIAELTTALVPVVEAECARTLHEAATHNLGGPDLVTRLAEAIRAVQVTRYETEDGPLFRASTSAQIAAALVPLVRAECTTTLRTAVDRVQQKIVDWEPTCSEAYIRGMRVAVLYVTSEADEGQRP